MSHLKNTLISATLLATAPTVKGYCGIETESSETSKSQRRINHLTLEEVPLENLTLCVPGKTTTALTGDFRFLPNKLSVVIEPLVENVKLAFIVSQITACDKKRKLILIYSTQLASPSPQILTPKSINKLELDLEFSEIMGIYNIPEFGLETQPKISMITGEQTSNIKWAFNIPLDNLEILKMMRSGYDRIYVQAALLESEAYESGKFDQMILSEVDTIHFVLNKCPMVMDDQRVTEFKIDEKGLIKSDEESGIGKTAIDF
jgi:hypothetical protein